MLKDAGRAAFSPPTMRHRTGENPDIAAVDLTQLALRDFVVYHVIRHGGTSDKQQGGGEKPPWQGHHAHQIAPVLTEPTAF